MTDDKRYAPPATSVADPERVPLLAARPQQVRVAVALLWASFVLGIVAWLLSSLRDPETGFSVLVLVITGLLFAFSVLLNVMVYRGRNWARVVVLVFVALAGLLLLAPIEEASSPSMAEQVINLVTIALECVAMFLVFTQPGSLWFKRRT
jgi:hypothetical protein